MKIVISIDSFKGSLSSMQAGNAAKEGILRVYPDAEIVIRPLADGGEGTVDALTAGLGGKLRTVTVTGPLGAPVQANYGILEESKTAVIEMSAAAGITLVKEEERNPLETTTYGVGELIKDAIANGCRKFLIGIGGSATNDGGVGMLSALGFSFLDENGGEIALGAKGLKDLKTIETKNVLPELKNCTFQVACDVTNPLCGENGCSAIYGPQKGADSEMIKEMDLWLSRFSELSKTVFQNANPDSPGAGAAGGMGFAFETFLNGSLARGVELVLKETDLESFVKDADVVVTGEGRLDSQTAMGKAPAGVAALSKKYGKKVVAFSGCATRDANMVATCGIDAFFPIARGASSLEEAMDIENAQENMADTVEQVFRLIKTYE